VTRPASFISLGILYSLLWASASVAGKFGLRSAEPLVLFNLRFFGAGILLLVVSHVVLRERLPSRKEWGQLTLFGALNTTLYLGLFVLALDEVTPGITTLAVALNPLLISVFSAVWMSRKVRVLEWAGILIGITGVLVASYPHLETSFASVRGLVLIAFSQVAYSIGAVYYARVDWTISRMSVNAWQAFLGAFLTLPFTFLMHEEKSTLDLRLLLSLAWLIVPVSVIAIQLWLRLLKQDAVRASMWLYLCPPFGFLYAWALVGERLSLYTFVGTAMVLGALWLGQARQGTGVSEKG